MRNALGSAVAQNRGLGAYLPAVCRHLFGEELLVTDAPRWWLGDAANRAHVIANLDRMVIHSAQEGTGRPGGAQYGQLGSSLTEAQRRTLKEEIGLHGEVLVAEERIGFGTTPAFTAQGLVPQPFAVRLFVAATADGFTVMPGGLAMAIVPNLAVALSAPEARTRDVWIVADGEVPPHRSLWQPTIETARVQRSQRVIQSRVADDLFWLGRYAERTDWIMRVLRSALQPLRGDNAPSHVQGAARACLEALAMRDEAQVVTPSDGDDAAAVERMVHLLITAKDGRRTLDGTLDKLYRVANLTRDRLSLEAWRVLSHFRPGADWRRELLTAPPEALLDLLEDGLGWLSAFNGLMHENMTRNKGWSFLDMGRRVERAGNMSEAILWLFGHPLEREEEAGRLFFLLEVADSFITYRSRYRLDPDAGPGARPLAARRNQPAQPRLSALQHLAAPRRLAAIEAGRQPHRRAPPDPVDADIHSPRRRRSASPRTRRATSCRLRFATSSACCRSSPTPSSGTTSTCSKSSRIASTPASSRNHDLRCEPSHDLPLLESRWRRASTSSTCRRVRWSGSASRATRCSSSRRRPSARSARTTTAIARCCSTSSSSTRSSSCTRAAPSA